jgi:beta-lactamase regulating signal transducer with metallopeptidase domain
VTAAFVVYILIVTLPLIGAAMLTEKILRLWKWPVRGAWVATAIAILLIGGRTAVQQMTSSPAQLVIAPTTQATPIHHADAGAMANLARIASNVTSFPRSAAAYAAHAAGPAQSRVLTTLWCVASAVMLIFVCIVYARVWYIARRWKVTEFAGLTVRVAPHAGPAVIGLFRPEVVVPYWMLEYGTDDSRLVVMHETEHQRARDPLLLAAMWSLVALFPWHPGAWYCLARTRLAIELDCDARVVRRGASLRTYAALLLNQARARLGAPAQLWLGATSLLEPSSHLERRLNAMIPHNDPSLAPRRLTRYLRTLSYLAVISTIAVAACESHVPTAADISGLDAASAETNARKASIIDDKPVTFYVDNVKVSADSAHAIDAKNISSIRVMKGSKLASGNKIWIAMMPDSAYLARRVDPAAANGSDKKIFSVRMPKTIASGVALDQSTSTAKQKQPFTGLVMIDGVASDVSAMKSIDPSTIATVEVIKGPAAMEQYTDPRAKDGVIVISLKH